MTWRLFEKVRKLFPPLRSSWHRGLLLLAATLFSLPTSFAFAQGPSAVPDIFNTVSTPADAIHRLSLFVLVITGLIFVVVFSLLVYAVIRFRHHSTGDDREPPQVYGSNQMELAWTVVPVLIVLVLFFATARVIQSVQDAIPPAEHPPMSPLSVISFGGSSAIRPSASSPPTNSTFPSAIAPIRLPLSSNSSPPTPTTASGFRS